MIAGPFTKTTYDHSASLVPEDHKALTSMPSKSNDALLHGPSASAGAGGVLSNGYSVDTYLPLSTWTAAQEARMWISFSKSGKAYRKGLDR